MTISEVLRKWKSIVNIANDKGVPLPMVRDPQTLEGSVSLSLVVISSILVTVGIISKWSGWLGGVDMNNAFNFFYASTTLYFGHNWVNKEPVAVDPAQTPKADDPDAK